MTSGLSTQNVARHLRTFLTSHGIPCSNPNLNDLLDRLVSEAASPTTSSVEKAVAKIAGSGTVSVVTTHLDSTSLTSRRPTLSEMSQEGGVGTYTRYQTPMFEAISK